MKNYLKKMVVDGVDSALDTFGIVILILFSLSLLNINVSDNTCLLLCIAAAYIGLTVGIVSPIFWNSEIMEIVKIIMAILLLLAVVIVLVTGGINLIFAIGVLLATIFLMIVATIVWKHV